MGLLGACDVVVAGPHCTFALTESRLGLAPAIISLTLSGKVDPRSWARYALGGEAFSPEEALRIGLVTMTGEDPNALCNDVIATYRLASPQGLAETKALINATMVDEFESNAEQLLNRSAELFASPEAQEGIAAFKERRAPRWVST